MSATTAKHRSGELSTIMRSLVCSATRPPFASIMPVALHRCPGDRSDSTRPAVPSAVFGPMDLARASPAHAGERHLEPACKHVVVELLDGPPPRGRPEAGAQ